MPQKEFLFRHLNTQNTEKKLNTLNYTSIKALIADTIPHNILEEKPLKISKELTEEAYLQQLKEISKKYHVF